MTVDVSLLCECGNKLGILRKDGVFASRKNNRVFEVVDANLSGLKVTCEQCQRGATFDKLRQRALG